MKKLFVQLMVMVSLVSFAQASDKLTIIKFEKAKALFENQNALFLDARGAKLYKKGTILGSLNVPVKAFGKLQNFLPIKKDAKVVSFCNGFKCEKSDELAVLLQKAGYTNVLVYKGGYPEWKEKKMPLMGLQKEKKEVKVAVVKPEGKMVTLNGAKVYLGADKGMIDQNWFASVVLSDMPKNIQLIDVRKASDFKDGHLPGAINVPWDSKKEKIDTSKFPKGKLAVLYCNTGMQSAESALSIASVGKDVLYFDAEVTCKGKECKVVANEDL